VITDSVSLSYEDFRQRFEAVSDPRDSALIASIYCSYARVGEVVRGKYSKKNTFMREHVKFTPTHLLLTIKTEKTHKWRTVPTSRGLEDWLHEPIRNYLSYHKAGIVFPISTRWAEKIFKKHFGTEHIHLLRHWATTHCVQGKRTKTRLKSHDIARLGGWTNLTTFDKIYSHFVTEDLHELI